MKKYSLWQIGLRTANAFTHNIFVKTISRNRTKCVRDILDTVEKYIEQLSCQTSDYWIESIECKGTLVENEDQM